MRNNHPGLKHSQNPGDYSSQYPKEYNDYNTQYGGKIERIGWKWWDTQTYISGVTTSLPQWFNVRATPDLGNMEVAFQLAAPKAFLVRAIRFFAKVRPRAITPPTVNGNPLTGTLDDIAQLVNTGVFIFTVGNKQYAMEPLWCLTSGGGAFGVMSVSNTAANSSSASHGSNGIPDPRAVNTCPTPLFIAPQINFTAVVTWPVALTLAGGNTDITFLLEGDQLRPVQ